MKMNKCFLLCSCILLLFYTKLNAQVRGGKLNKLFDMYILEKYEKCAIKAEKLSLRKKYKRNPEPFLYLSMCLYVIAENPDLNTDTRFKKAKKDAIKYGAKFIKADLRLKKKGKPYLLGKNKEFIEKLKYLGITEAYGFFIQNKYSKAAYYYKLIYKLDKNDPTILIMMGTLYLLSNNSNGKEYIKLALEKFQLLVDKGGYTPSEYVYKAFEDGFLYYADYLIDKKKNKKAMEMMELARTIDPKNKSFALKMTQIDF